jgi:hypothetical protein
MAGLRAGYRCAVGTLPVNSSFCVFLLNPGMQDSQEIQDVLVNRAHEFDRSKSISFLYVINHVRTLQA